ncbi:MAG: hypothetical protein HC835_22130 [Oscillatoriales cyanobacterium RM2_1_1]|nr:hypothetical protein [Oscillatoriales cyanobacterium RM2_1_1]
MFGGADPDTLSGDLGNDTSYGGSGADLLFGGDGDDYLSGQDGPDILIGSTFQTSSTTQVDFLNGGGGADVFVLDRQVTSYGHNGHYAVIEDFEFGDLIDIDTSDYVILPTSILGLGTGVAIYGSSLFYQPGTTESLVGLYKTCRQ